MPFPFIRRWLSFLWRLDDMRILFSASGANIMYNNISSRCEHLNHAKGSVCARMPAGPCPG